MHAAQWPSVIELHQVASRHDARPDVFQLRVNETPRPQADC